MNVWLKPLSLVPLLSLGACSSPKLINNDYAPARFAALSGNGEKRIAKDFYQMGGADQLKRAYWRQLNGVGYPEHKPVADAGTGLQRRYVTLPVPAAIDPDGTVKEAHLEVVEVVQ
jgi:hypothetical protein